MCKGIIDAFYCHSGVLGEPLCPWRDNLTGLSAPYLRRFRVTAWECCGNHVDDCSNCPLATGDNITTVPVPALDCNECAKRIDAEGKRDEETKRWFLEFLNPRQRIALPRFQREIAEGRTDLTLDELLWGVDGEQDLADMETIHVTRACMEAEQEEQEAKAAKEKEEKERAEKVKAEKEEDAKLWSDFTTLNDDDVKGEDGEDGEEGEDGEDGEGKE